MNTSLIISDPVISFPIKFLCIILQKNIMVTLSLQLLSVFIIDRFDFSDNLASTRENLSRRFLTK